MNAATYSRVSTEEQSEHGTSLDMQRAKTRAYAEAQGWTVVDEFVDAGVSGKRESRPAFDRLMHACRSGEVDVLIVARVDRLGRSNRLIANALHELEAAGVRFVSVAENFDTSTPMGRGMLAMAGVFAEIDHALIVERMAAGKRTIIEQGFWHGGRVPFGFRPVDDGGHKRLVVDEDAAETIRLAADLILSGCSCHEVSKRLNALERPPSVATRWDEGTLVRHTLSREATCPAILDKETFAKVQEALARRRHPRARDRSYPLSKRLVVGDREYVGTYRKDQGARYYVSPGSPSYRADEIEKRVWEAVVERLNDPDDLIAFAEEYLGLRASREDVAHESVDDLDARIGGLDRAIRTTLATSAKAGLTPADIEAATHELVEEREALLRHRAEIETWRRAHEAHAERVGNVRDLVHAAGALVVSMREDEAGALFDLLDVRVTVLEHEQRKSVIGRGQVVVAPVRLRIDFLLAPPIARQMGATPSPRS